MPVPVATRLVNSPLIGIIGLPRSNSASVVAAFRSIGKNAVIIGSEKELTSSIDAIVLPGVGRFGPAAQYLGKSNLGKRVRDLYSDGISIMGICLGMQLLGDSSEESPGAEGLGILSMVSSRLSSKKHGLVPNVGWHEVTFQSQLDPSGEKAAGWFYFSHSITCLLLNRCQLPVLDRDLLKFQLRFKSPVQSVFSSIPREAVSPDCSF